MTDTELTANAAHERHVPADAENFGRLAAQLELEAYRPGTPAWLVASLMDQAQSYRDAQAAAMNRDAERRLGDWNAAHQAELEDQARFIDAYPLANILLERSRRPRWTAYLLTAVAIALAAALLILSH